MAAELSVVSERKGRDDDEVEDDGRAGTEGTKISSRTASHAIALTPWSTGPSRSLVPLCDRALA